MRSNVSTEKDVADDPLTATFAQLGLSSSQSAAHQTAHLPPPFPPPPPPARPCVVCGWCLPAVWLDDGAMSYYFSRLRIADSADVSGKCAFWTPMIKQSQSHQRCNHSAAAHSNTATTTPALSFTLQDMQYRFTRVSCRHNTSRQPANQPTDGPSIPHHTTHNTQNSTCSQPIGLTASHLSPVVPDMWLCSTETLPLVWKRF